MYRMAERDLPSLLDGTPGREAPVRMRQPRLGGCAFSFMPEEAKVIEDFGIGVELDTECKRVCIQ